MSEAAEWPSVALSPGVRVELVAAPAAPAGAAGREVARLWEEARRARPGLFNGRILSAIEVTRDAIVGHWTEYRLALAQIMRPALYDDLRIRSVAVNGVVECADGFVFGRRDPEAVYQAGMWQCPPAGSVEAREEAASVDLVAQVLAELEEELGLRAADVDAGAIRALCAVEHPGSHVIDVGMALSTRLGFGEIAARHAATGNREYGELVAVARGEVEARLDAWGETVVPPARFFIGALLER